MLGKGTKKSQKVEPEPEESEEEVEAEEEEVEAEEEESGVEMEGEGEEEGEEVHERLMEDILAHASEAQEGEKLTWNAIYALKQKEWDLNEQLKQQIEKIKAKYQMLKQPIFHQVSAVALGQRVEESLYTPQGLQAGVDPKTVIPQKIEHFWGIVLDKEGLLIQEIDVDCITKASKFIVELLDHETNHMRITFKFSSPTQYFSNLELAVETHYDNEKKVPVRQLKQKIKYTKEKVEHSMFTLLFDGETDLNQFYNVACEVYHDYSNALYYYFREEAEEGEDEAIAEHEDQEDEDDEEDDQVQEVNKPGKKVKPDQQKPECKNQ